MEEIHLKLFNELEKRGVSVYAFSKQTGIPKERVYKWKQGEGKPKAEDSIKIQQWLSEEDRLSVQTSNVKESEAMYHGKYMALLESNIEFLKGVLLSNLGNISVSQQHLRALAIAQLNQMAKLRAKAEGKSVQKVMDEINKEVADAALSIEQKDILSGILGKGEKA